MDIRAQAGPQEQFLSSPADIAIIGGAAGGTKSFSLLLEPTRHINTVKGFGSVIFRRTRPMLRKTGSVWDESFRIYNHIGGRSREQSMSWVFSKSGQKNRIVMDQLEHENTIYDHHSAQYPLIEFDELVQFTKKQFFYMLSRNRSLCGVKPYIRAGTNPMPSTDPVGGWVRDLIDWWINEDGSPNMDKSGILRYFARDDDDIIFVDRDWRSSEGDPPKSITFIPSFLSDNPILMKRDPGYRQNLNTLSRVDRMRLKGGNWNVREEDGMFEDSWFGTVDHSPRMRLIRYWDRAATKPTPTNPDPDWTAGALIGMYEGDLYILDMVHFRGNPAYNEKKIQQTAAIDGKGVVIYVEQEGGSAGVDTFHHYQTKVLRGYTVRPDRPSGSKTERAKPWCALAEFGHVLLGRGPWNRNFLSEAEQFPTGKRDQIDAVSGGYSVLNSSEGARMIRHGLVGGKR